MMKEVTEETDIIDNIKAVRWYLETHKGTIEVFLNDSLFMHHLYKSGTEEMEIRRWQSNDK